MIDAGVIVGLGSDATAPDRSSDMFRHIQQLMHYHRTHYRDASYMPPGKALEMATIDGARRQWGWPLTTHDRGITMGCTGTRGLRGFQCLVVCRGSVIGDVMRP